VTGAKNEFVPPTAVIMSAAVLVTLLALVHAATSQSTTSGGNTSNGYDFLLDSLTTGILTLFCIFTFFFLLLTVWCIVALIIARGHRAPYMFLLPALILTTFGNGGNIALEVFLNMSSWYYIPTQLIEALEAIQWFFANWAILLLFLSIMAVLWNRETALDVATEGAAGRRHRLFTVTYAVITLILFALGLAGPIVYLDAVQKYDIATNQIVYFDPIAWLEERRKVWRSIRYAFNSIVVLTGVVVIVSTIRLWRAGRGAGIRDKITNAMLYIVSPLYAAYNLVTVAFTVAFSDRGPPATRSQTTFEAVTLVDNLLLLLLYFAVAFTLVVMSVNGKNWNIQEGTVQPSDVPTQQPVQANSVQPMSQPADHHAEAEPQMHEVQVHTQQEITQIPA